MEDKHNFSCHNYCHRYTQRIRCMFCKWKNRRYLLTYLLTLWCRVLLKKLTGLQPVKKFPAFYGTWRFITALTSVRHLSLSWDNPIQSTYPHPTSWRSILILSTHLRLGKLVNYWDKLLTEVTCLQLSHRQRQSESTVPLNAGSILATTVLVSHVNYLPLLALLCISVFPYLHTR